MMNTVSWHLVSVDNCTDTFLGDTPLCGVSTRLCSDGERPSTTGGHLPAACFITRPSTCMPCHVYVCTHMVYTFRHLAPVYKHTHTYTCSQCHCRQMCTHITTTWTHTTHTHIWHSAWAVSYQLSSDSKSVPLGISTLIRNINPILNWDHLHPLHTHTSVCQQLRQSG